MAKEWVVIYSYRRLRKVRPRRWLPRGRSRFHVMTGRWRFGLTAVAHRGICVTDRWNREVVNGLSPGAQWYTMEFPSMKKKVSKSAEGVKHLAAMETNLFASLMPLVEHCALRQYDDGEARETGWVTIKTQGAAWCIQVKDPDAAVSFTAVADTLDKALETAALLLGCDDAPWELDRFLAQQKANGKKK